MMPRPKIVLMPIWVPPNMATVPKILPPVVSFRPSCQVLSFAWSTIGSGM